MIDRRYLLRFDLFQQLVIWLNISTEAIRKGRRFLDTNQTLLLVETERELERLITARVEDRLEMTQKMHHHQILLRDARRRGGTPDAIQEAYVNMYGGIAALDLPPWLETIEKQRTFLNQLRRPERTVRARINLLYDALSSATHDGSIAPEIIAELQCELGNLLAHSPHPYTFESHLEMLKEAIACYEEALNVYTVERYPWQYAKVYISLGDVYLQYGIATRQADMIEHAISCYNATFWIYNPDEFPEQWAMLQTSLGHAYAQRRMGDPEENTTHAISCHHSSLRVATLANFPVLWARAQINLGDLYQQSVTGGRITNLKWARACYQAALQVYERATFPKEWADLHARLASIFQRYAEEDVKEQDLHQRCALVCYECALQIYTPDAFPVEYATTLVNLGNVYRNRSDGEQSVNRAQALQCYRDALCIFTSQSFPLEYSRVQNALTEMEASPGPM